MEHRAGQRGRFRVIKRSFSEPSYITTVTDPVLIQVLFRLQKMNVLLWQNLEHGCCFVHSSMKGGSKGVQQRRLFLFNCKDKLGVYNTIVAIVTVQCKDVFN